MPARILTGRRAWRNSSLASVRALEPRNGFRERRSSRLANVLPDEHWPRKPGGRGGKRTDS